jgi:hypothetical protein
MLSLHGRTNEAKGVYHTACSAQAATSIPAMAPSAAARASQSRQKGGCGVLMFLPPTPPATRRAITPYTFVSNMWPETLSDVPMHFNRVSQGDRTARLAALERSTELSRRNAASRCLPDDRHEPPHARRVRHSDELLPVAA